jgi:hypothetical protein
MVAAETGSACSYWLHNVVAELDSACILMHVALILMQRHNQCAKHPAGPAHNTFWAGI